MTRGDDRVDATGRGTSEDRWATTSSAARPPHRPAAGRRPPVSPVVLAVAVLAVVLFVALGLALRPGGEGAPRRAGGVRVPLESRELAARLERGSVFLRSGDALGAGFFVAPDLVLTNAHVVEGQDPAVTVIRADGRRLDGVREAVDPWLDAALVRVPGADGEPLPLGDAGALVRGDRVALMGTPRGLDFSYAEGVVSHPARAVLGLSYLQIDAAVNPGNSGGPLVDRAGNVVGIVSMAARNGVGLGLALPVNYLYEGARPLLGRRDEVLRDRDRWGQRVAAAVRDDRAAVERLRSSAGEIELAGVRLAPDRTVVAVVDQWSVARPDAARLTFELAEAARVHCRPSATFDDWRDLAAIGAASGYDRRTLLWLERHRLRHRVWVAGARLDMTGCPDPAAVASSELLLRRGGDEVTRVRISDG